MIALRGKLERTKKERAVDDDTSASTPSEKTATSVGCEDGYEWTWKGHWAFGLELPDDPKKLQPFVYVWGKSVNPEDVIVVSLNYAPDDDEMAGNGTANNNDDDGNNTVKAEPDDGQNEEAESHGQVNTTKEEGMTAAAVSSEMKVTNEVGNGKTTEASATPDKQDKLAQAATEKTTIRTPSTANAIPAEAKSSQEAQETGLTDMSGVDSSTLDSTASATASKRQRITFATALSPDSPPFTDASEKYPDKCPPGGEWKGYFENIVKVPTKRNGKSPPAPKIVQQIREQFIIYINATPPKEAQTWFMTENPVAPTPTKRNSRKSAGPETPLPPTEDSTPSGVLKDGLMHVRGTGTNQFGTFELLGSFDVETGMLECQRMYVAHLEDPKPMVRRRSRPGVTLDGSVRTKDDDRPYFTRKRQGSWKRKSSFGVSADEDEEGDASGSGTARRRSASTGSASGHGGKRVRVAEAKTATTAVEAEALPELAGVAATSVSSAPIKLSIAVPVSTISSAASSATKRPGPSPKTGTPRAKKAASGNPTSVCPKLAGATSTLPAASSAGMYMKLPTVGDPKNAIWRAAHYLYYQKNDPAQEEGGAGGTNPTSSNAAAGNAYKYVVYEGELYKSQREGRGVCLYSNQMLYEGEWKKNKEHGRGTLMTADRKRIIYEGEWERGRMHGRGTYYYSSGVVLNAKQQVVLSDDNKGKKKNPPGLGNTTEAVQSRYEGDFKENLRHGMGTYVLPDGSVYVGSWREGVMCGRGTFTWNDGSQYTGDWKDGKRHGTGLLTCSDGFSYDGAWAFNAMEGRGTATYPNGQTYNGLFHNGRREGRGTLRFTNGAVYEGRFRDDRIDGQGTIKFTTVMTIPREKKPENEDGGEKADEKQQEEEKGDIKPDFMIPLSFQSDMSHIHQKAGFTVGGE